MSSRFIELRRYFQGWIGYFHYGLRKTQLQYLDKWIRRRICACYWKQWYRVRTRVRMLLKLGVRRDEAISHGCAVRYFKPYLRKLVRAAVFGLVFAVQLTRSFSAATATYSRLS